MIFYNCLRLACRLAVQVLKVLFYCLVFFVLIFGCMFAFASVHFEMLVHARVFDSLLAIIRGIFVEMNVGNIVAGVQSLRLSIVGYGESLVGQGFAVEIILGVLLLLFLLIAIFWYRFAVNRDIYYHVNGLKKHFSLKNIIQKPGKSIVQVLTSFAFTLVYDICAIIGCYFICKALVPTCLAQSVKYMLFAISAILLLSVRMILFNGWEYAQLVGENTCFTAYKIKLKYTFKHFWSYLYNTLLIMLLSWAIVIACGQLLVGWLIILGLAIWYVLIKCFGAVAYYQCQNESFYIGKKEVIPHRINKIKGIHDERK